MRNHPVHKAFSLIETLIVSALIAGLSGILALFFVHVHGGFFGARAAADIQKDASAIVRELEQFVLPGERILETVSIDGDEYTSGEETLILQVPAITDSGESISGVSDTVVLYRAGAVFARRIDADGQSARVSGTRQLTDSLEGIAFSYSTEDVTLASRVSVELSVAKVVKGRSVEAVRRAQFTLRNVAL